MMKHCHLLLPYVEFDHEPFDIYCSIYSFFAIKKWHRPLNFLSYKKFLRSSNDYVFLRLIFFCWVFIRLLVRAWQSNVIEVENHLKYLIVLVTAK